MARFNSLLTMRVLAVMMMVILGVNSEAPLPRCDEVAARGFDTGPEGVACSVDMIISHGVSSILGFEQLTGHPEDDFYTCDVDDGEEDEYGEDEEEEQNDDEEEEEEEDDDDDDDDKEWDNTEDGQEMVPREMFCHLCQHQHILQSESS
ncbi:hypothetical protein BO78DRAFT_394900 [Aspergillus sclerotiicarbonarius CBS 121057]|uniref:Uncharacterized protein n=1 Tax=Aspergillus sclerotiicarbonarius (strain CBS 121057 / IBT 28362) TaxID=1448318 RepID=A0A319EGC0_ASPSB|nr:hypothetical protein BO78DRAFT_394900 [Aspergillus sclerotiicarbonarius CBS 121057]